MFITINGHLGSGKSTVCTLIKEQYDFEVFNTGSIQREIANQMQISTLELNKKSKEDFSVDHLIDNTIIEFATEHNGDNIIFDSRLAWHFVPKSFKVRLTIDPAIDAQRVFKNRKSQEESYLSLEETLEKLADRQQTETERYKMIYNLDINDKNNYDLIVDTSYLSPQKVADVIIYKYEQWLKTL